MSHLSRSILALGSLILFSVGIPIFVGPIAYQAGMGVDLPVDPTLLSDLRAMAGALIGLATLLSAGVFSRRFGFTAATAGAIAYGAYGLSRLVSMAVDGLPSSSLITAAAIELVMGAALAGVALDAWEP